MRVHGYYRGYTGRWERGFFSTATTFEVWRFVADNGRIFSFEQLKLNEQGTQRWI